MPSLRRCSASRTTTNTQFCALPAEGARTAASRIRVMISCGTGSGLSRRNARAEYMASNKPISGMADPPAPNSFGAYRALPYTQHRAIAVSAWAIPEATWPSAQPSLAAPGVLSSPGAQNDADRAGIGTIGHELTAFTGGCGHAGADAPS